MMHISYKELRAQMILDAKAEVRRQQAIELSRYASIIGAIIIGLGIIFYLTN